jgi:hypothetical protein
MHKYVDLIFLKILIGHSYFSDKQGISYAIYKFRLFSENKKNSKI